MELTDLLSVEEWMTLEKEIHNRYGLDTNVFNTDGIRITPYKSWINRICPEIKATDKGQSFICAVAHMNLAVMARNSGQAVVEECDAGIVKIVVPVFVADIFVGAVGACGKCLEDGEVDAFLVNKVTGIDEAKVESLARDIERISPETIAKLIAYVEEKIQNIIHRYETRR
ncbi:PocR ligand-binding domain-containing protein [Thermodesulfobacteriota bacterium]